MLLACPVVGLRFVTLAPALPIGKDTPARAANHLAASNAAMFLLNITKSTAENRLPQPKQNSPSW